MRTEKFDWDLCRYGDKRKKWLKANQNTPFTEEEFISAWKELGGSRHSPSICKKNYRNLKTKFGFFTN